MNAKKLLIVLMSVTLISLFTVPAMAFLDDNSTDNSTNASAETEAAASVTQIDNSTNKANASQTRAIPGNVPIPGGTGFFTTPTPDGSFETLKTALMFANMFSEQALVSLAAGGSVRIFVKDLSPKISATFEDSNNKMIKIVLDVPKGLTYKGPANGEAKNGSTNSIQVMAAIALKALRNGSNVVYFAAEGAHRGVETSGWGIGFAHTKASHDNVSAGGTGYAAAKAGPQDKPWLQGFAFVE
jgi:hypothetical protein